MRASALLAGLALPMANGNNCNGGRLSAQLPDAECDAWHDFYDALGGPNWVGCSGSRDGPCECMEMAGVACNRHDLAPRIIWIDMDANNMHGTIPASVEAWTELTGMTLSGNSITGPLPKVNYTKFYQQSVLIDASNPNEHNAFTCPVPKGALEKCTKTTKDGQSVNMAATDCVKGTPTPAPKPTPAPGPGPHPPAPTPPAPLSGDWCGTTWADATKCHSKCNGYDSSCPAGEHCYASIACK